MRGESLKLKHVQALVEHWKRQPTVSDATIENRLAALRWWAEKVGKTNIIPKHNIELGIGRRRAGESAPNKAKTLSGANLRRIRCPCIRTSLKLQAVFGLRREEAMKIQPGWAGQGDRIALRGSWCKGGRPREIPIRNDRQRAILEEAKRLSASGSLIPARKSYRDHLAAWKSATKDAGISRTHGLRHQYAQTRYRELTGSICPAAGGKPIREMNDRGRVADRLAREQIAREPGHDRTAIVQVYCG